MKFFIKGENIDETQKKDDDGDGDFEDLEESAETSVPVESKEEPVLTIEQEREANARRKEELSRKFNDKYEEKENDPEETFYEAQKAEMARQQQLNREEFENEDPETRAQIEGFRAGTYVRIVIEKMPCEFMDNFNPEYPVIVGGLLPSEETFGFLQVEL